MSAADPFDLVKEEIDDLVKKVESTFGLWERYTVSSSERAAIKREVITGIERVESQVNELERAIAVVEQDPARFNIDAAEIDRRRKWAASTHDKIDSMRTSIANGGVKKARRELMRMSDDRHGPKPDRAILQANEDFLEDESEQQALIIRKQDEDLDELTASVVKIGDLGIVIGEELKFQDQIVDDLNKDIEGTGNRLDVIQKRMRHVIKKAGAKAQIVMIIFLVVLLLLLIFLVFFF